MIHIYSHLQRCLLVVRAHFRAIFSAHLNEKFVFDRGALIKANITSFLPFAMHDSIEISSFLSEYHSIGQLGGD